MPAAPPPDAPTRASALPPFQVLIIDDHPDCAKSLALLLRRQGHKVCVALSGSEALAAADKHVPDLVFVEVRLKGEDGFAIIEHLQKLPGPCRTSVIALTGSIRQGDRVRVRRSGWDTS